MCPKDGYSSRYEGMDKIKVEYEKPKTDYEFQRFFSKRCSELKEILKKNPKEPALIMKTLEINIFLARIFGAIIPKD